MLCWREGDETRFYFLVLNDHSVLYSDLDMFRDPVLGSHILRVQRPSVGESHITCNAVAKVRGSQLRKSLRRAPLAKWNKGPRGPCGGYIEELFK